MMSATLPLALLSALPSEARGCTWEAVLSRNSWPLPHLIDKHMWETPKDRFKGWAPGSKLAERYRQQVPKWLPSAVPHGFSKWAAHNSTGYAGPALGGSANTWKGCPDINDGNAFYNPIDDPLKMTNYGDDVLDVLRSELSSGRVTIKHVALIMLESYREDLFPLLRSSSLHRKILASHKGAAGESEVNLRLSQLGPVAERISGRSGGFGFRDGSDLSRQPLPMRDNTTRVGFGGINVVGSLAAASLSFKSMAATHCGVWPMAVDNFEESEAQSYQPCIPQILNLFNMFKEHEHSTDFLEQKWRPALFQSITDRYDRQHKFDEKIGFNHTVTKHQLERSAESGGGGSDLEKINYFGYPETALKPHMEEYIEKALRENKRIFFSHFTSTTHHPWGVPKAFPTVEYFDTQGALNWHKDFNSYLNAMRFTDEWLGNVLKMFEDFGLSDETLFIFVGDHGQAFKEDMSSKTGTYENSHISNFRIPMTFRHPNIPLIQYNASVTPISILPTLFDLLVSTGSLNKNDADIASDLIPDYEGQSLIRPLKSFQGGRRAWNFGIVNSGARMLSVTSADTSWRLVMPLRKSCQYRFTSLEDDPLELDAVENWNFDDLINNTRSKHGEVASQWATEARKVAAWWAVERRRLWGYHQEAPIDDMAKGP